MGAIFQGLIIIFAALLFGLFAIIFLLTWLRSHRLKIRDPTNNKAYITEYWIFEKKDKESGVMNWVSVLGKKKLCTPKPPAEAVDIGKRGRKYAEAYKISEDEFVWIKDKGLKLKEVVDENGVRKMQAVDTGLDGGEKVIDTFKPFSPVQRAVVVNQYRKAQEMKNKRWTADKIVTMTSIVGIVFLGVMLMIFWGDIAKPALESHAMAQGIQKENFRLLSEIEKLKNCQGVGQHIDSQPANVIITNGSLPIQSP